MRAPAVTASGPIAQHLDTSLLLNAYDHARRLENGRSGFTGCETQPIDTFIGDDRSDLRPVRCSNLDFGINRAFGDS